MTQLLYGLTSPQALINRGFNLVKRTVYWLSFLLGIAGSPLAHAQTTFNWLNTSGGSYHTAGNWTPGGGPPIFDDFARFGLNSTYTVSFANNGTQTIDFQVRGGNVTFSYLNGTANHFWGSGSTNYVGPQVGDVASAATLNLTNMSSNPMRGNHLIVGYAAGKTGTLNIHTNGHWLGYAGSNVFVGTAGTGNLNITTAGILQKAILEANNVSIGDGANGAATVSGVNASLNVNNVLTVGNGSNAVGTLAISNQGSVSVSDSVFIGVGSQNASNAISVNGNNSVLALGNDVLVVGASGSGKLLVSNGGEVVNTLSSMTLGQGTGSFGQVSISGAGSHFSSTGTNTMIVGADGVGELSITGGGLADIARVRLGDSASGTGSLNVSGTGSFLNLHGASENIVGVNGSGTATVSNGGVMNSNAGLVMGSNCIGTLSVTSGGQVYSTSGRIGSLNAANGSDATIDGNGSLWSMTGSVDLGWNQYATLNISNGGAITSNGGRLGVASGGEGLAQLSGSGTMWNTAAGSSTFVIGQAGSGTINVSSGAAMASNTVLLASQSSGNGSVWVNGAGSTWTVNDALFLGDVGAGMVSVTGGGQLTMGNNSVMNIGAGTSSSGILRLTDSASQVTFGSGSTMLIGGQGSGELQVLSGTVSGFNAVVGNAASASGNVLLRNPSANWQLTNDLTIASLGTATVDVESGATLSAANIFVGKSAGSTGVVNLRGANSSLTTSQNLVLGGDSFSEGGAAQLNVNSAATVDVSGAVRLRSQGELFLNGGEMHVGTIIDNGGQFHWHSGKVQFKNDTDLTHSLLDTMLGTSHTLGNFQTLAMNANTNLELQPGFFTVDGGQVTGSDFANGGNLSVRRGAIIMDGGLLNTSSATFAIQETGKVSFSQGVMNEGTFLLDSIAAQSSGGTFTNHGTLAGTGRLQQRLVNNGTVHVSSNDYLTIASASSASSNSGQMQVNGGRLEFTRQLTNLSSGLITGHGVLATGTSFNGIGLFNEGIIAASGQTFDVYGDVRNATGGRFITSGNGTTTFWDDVEHNGAEIRTSLGSSTVFFGDVTGAGPFTGAGAVFFEGDLKPGNSPADVLFEGDVHFSKTASLSAELGGLSAGSEYDRLTVRGDVFLGGQFSVSMIDGFTPLIGDTFLIIDNRGVNSLFGQFTGLNQGSVLNSDGYRFQVDYFAGSSGNGFALVAVPEPGIGLFGLSLCALSCFRRRKMRSNSTTIIDERHLQNGH